MEKGRHTCALRTMCVRTYAVYEYTVSTMVRTYKAAKYADQDNFIPFILETGGRVNKAARDWLDALTAPEPGEQVPSQDDHPWNPQTRTTTVREAMQALVRVQAHMLARIVVESRAADIVMSSMLTTPTGFPLHLSACISSRF